MKRLLIAAGVCVLAWFVLKNPIYGLILTQGEPQQPAILDYTQAESWQSRPEDLPPGAWETPWGIDLFVVYPPPRLHAKHGLIPADTAAADASTTTLMRSVRDALPTEASVYSPKYRPPSEATPKAEMTRLQTVASGDITTAFEAYLADANRGRGILLIVVGDSLQVTTGLLDHLQSDELRNRFAGLVHITGPTNDANTANRLTISCSAALEDACYQSADATLTRPLKDHVLPRLPKLRPQYSIIDPEGTASAIATQITQVSTWLDSHAPKPAEPLTAIEPIDIAPIFRPGDDAPINRPTEN